jgi:outer membrane protein insertion porin family
MAKHSLVLAVAALLFVATSTAAEQGTPAAATRGSEPATVCGQQVAPPATLPPANSGPVVWLIAPCFEAQGNTSLIEPQTYVYYIQLRASRPSEGVWVPYDESVETRIRDDFHRLWNTNFLDNLWIEVRDYTFANGVVGKIVLYNMEERQRVKIVDYVGSKKIETTKIDEKLKEAEAQVRLDTFIDPGLIRKVEGIVRDMMKEKGFQYANVTHEIKEMPGGPKLVHLTFHMDEGPTVKIKTIDFVGNEAMGDGTLRRRMKTNKEQWFLSFMSGRGTYNETKFDEDAEKVVEYYRDHGYVRAVVGAPELRTIGDSPDKKTRYVELHIPVTEGKRYKVGTLDVAGNTVIKSELLKPLFKVKPGEYYSEKEVRKGLDKAREVYGSGGYFEFTGYPDLKYRDDPNPAEPEAPAALRAPEPEATAQALGPPVVDVTMRLLEGQQYFINRIIFVGNTTTHDNVIRRELNMVENNVFNTEGLKYSIKRLNQLGYFKPLEGGRDVSVDKTPGTTNKVDVKLKLEEQNRNQLTFGAGVSEFEGFFGQISFQTSNFLGRGESLTLSLQAGSRAQNYSLAFTEPFLFDRNITGGFNLFRSDVRYIGQFTQRTGGGVVTFGYPLGGFTRLFTNYSYERVRVTEINAQFCDPAVLASNPFLRDSLLLSGSSCANLGTATATETDPFTGQSFGTVVVGGTGARVISKIVPSLVHNTVDNPIFPTAGKRFTVSVDLAGIGGNTNFYKPLVEGVYYWKQNARFSLGMRANGEYIHSFTSGSRELPIFEKLFLGGEYSIRGFDIRTIGPQDPVTRLVLGGNKSLLFNIEQNIAIAGPVRLILFYDAGQVRDLGQPFSWKEDVTETTFASLLLPPIRDPAAVVAFNDGSPPITRVIGRQSAFKTSTGAEIRFMMPVLNVPFRLIFARNPQRGGVFDNTLRPQKAFQFRFAVGSTF